MLSECPPWVLLATGFAFGAVPRQALTAVQTARDAADELPSEDEGSGSSEGSDDS